LLIFHLQIGHCGMVERVYPPIAVSIILIFFNCGIFFNFLNPKQLDVAGSNRSIQHDEKLQKLTASTAASEPSPSSCI
jgi:hypothetical protein